MVVAVTVVENAPVKPLPLDVVELLFVAVVLLLAVRFWSSVRFDCVVVVVALVEFKYELVTLLPLAVVVLLLLPVVVLLTVRF